MEKPKKLMVSRGADRRRKERRHGRAHDAKNRVGQADRTFVDALVTLNADVGSVEGYACDVSEDGVKIILDHPPEVGPVSVKLVGMPIISGEICWLSARRVGVRLLRPLAPDVLADWIRCHGARR